MPESDSIKLLSYVREKIMTDICMPNFDDTGKGFYEHASCVDSSTIHYNLFTDGYCKEITDKFVLYSGQCVKSPLSVPGYSQTYVVADISSR